MPKKYYLVMNSFPGCLPEDAFVVPTLKDADESIRRIINDYADGWKYQWVANEQVRNENFEVTAYYSPRNKKRLIGAHIQYASYGGGINVEVQEIDYETAKEWDER